MPYQQDPARVLSGLGKSSVDVLHEYIDLVRIEGVDRLLNFSGPESCEDIHHCGEVAILQVQRSDKQHEYNT